MYDVLIVGAGVVGSSIARELSRYQLKIAVIEKFEDVAMGTTKANSAIIHTGFDAKPNTLKAKMNIKGNPMFDELSHQLDFNFRRNGSLVLCFNQNDLPKLHQLVDRGKVNGITNTKILSRNEVLAMEPNVNPNVVAALYSPTSGIVGPYEFTLALAENAAENGVEFFLNQRVAEITKADNAFLVSTDVSSYSSKILINAAGVHADDIHNILSKNKTTITPRAGQYILLDRTAGDFVNSTLFQLPTEMGKGILVTPTIDGNLLIGPTAADIKDKDDLSTTDENFRLLLESARVMLKDIPTSKIITSFTGVRAHGEENDFVIEHIADVAGMIDVRGIESPGLASSPAIALLVKELVGEITPLKENPSFTPYRKGISHFASLSTPQQESLIKHDPKYGRVICRCETVTEGEILDAIHRPLGATDLDGLKRRTRTSMGRCQGGFCSPHLVEILARELSLDPTQVTKFGGGSNILIGRNKSLGGSHHED